MNSHPSLSGRVALVTGSGRNIGRATVHQLARMGADVVVNTRTNRDEAELVAQEARRFGVRAVAVVADVAHQDQVEAMVELAVEELGGVDILINNVKGRFRYTQFEELTVKDWDTMFRARFAEASPAPRLRPR